MNRALALLMLGIASAELLGQSLWKEDASRSMIADKRAAAVGDILTIVVQESNTATKDAKTATSKETGIDAAIQAFLYSPPGQQGPDA